MGIEEPYEQLFGFVPQSTQTRHKFSSEVFPQILGIQEEFRRRMMHSGAVDEKTAHIVLFGILSSHMRNGATVHAIAARKLGATWRELHGICNLVFLFAGLSAMNFAINILHELKEQEKGGENGK